MAGALRIFRFRGISVYLHWSWFLVAVLVIDLRGKEYSSPVWVGLEWLALFVIVLLHEFGHAFACRMVGGRADQIMLTPLGGVTYVVPPPRPGPTLWSSAAGPLVNAALVPVLLALWSLADHAGWAQSSRDVYVLVRSIFWINVFLLVVNVLPIYPLDGGQMLRSVLWFAVGPAQSLMVAAVIGVVGTLGLIALAAALKSIWIGVTAGFMLLNCWTGIQRARAISTQAKMPRHTSVGCPACGKAPIMGPFWKCARCGASFDTFDTGGACPQCAERYLETQCSECGEVRPLRAWFDVRPLR